MPKTTPDRQPRDPPLTLAVAERHLVDCIALVLQLHTAACREQAQGRPERVSLYAEEQAEALSRLRAVFTSYLQASGRAPTLRDALARIAPPQWVVPDGVPPDPPPGQVAACARCGAPVVLPDPNPRRRQHPPRCRRCRRAP